MKKPAAEDKVIRNVLDYVKASHWINEILGFDQRDAHSNFKPELPHVDPARDGCGQQDRGGYLDYWHFVLDAQFCGNVRNDNYVPLGPYSFVEFADETEKQFGSENWRTIIARAWAREYPDRYEIWMTW